MDDQIKDKESAEYQWLKFMGSKSVEDFLWRSTDHGPEWSEKEINEALDGFCENLKRINDRQVADGRGEFVKDFAPKKTKKKLLEYIKKKI